jgi:thiol-disulfide isomerase/thioredoxin
MNEVIMNRRQFLTVPAGLSLAAAWPAVIAQTLAEASATTPPVLKGLTLDGKQFSLEQELGKVVLINFWATWCPTCRTEMPEMRANYEGWRSKGFNLITVSIDDEMKDIEQYEKLIQQTVPVKQQFPRLWRKQPGLQDNFGRIRGTPTSFLVNKKGQLVKRYQGRLPGAVWDEIAELVLT